MRIFPTVIGGLPAIGATVDEESAVAVPVPEGAGSPTVAYLSGSGSVRDDLAAALSDALSGARPALPLRDLRRPPVIDGTGKILCVGFNYRAHAAEMDADVAAAPNVFAKFANSLVGPGETIRLPSASTQIDYEGELAVIIGRTCYDVSAEDALRYVGGYTIMNDVTARDLQLRTNQWTLGKAIDTFAPVGPVIVTADEIPDPQVLSLTTRLNDEVVQDASTGDMIIDIAHIISVISQSMTLECGDLIATGTPEGVGYKRTPPRFLADGDSIEITISGIGQLRNPVGTSARDAAELAAGSVS